jgi:hypothetical protein
MEWHVKKQMAAGGKLIRHPPDEFTRVFEVLQNRCAQNDIKETRFKLVIKVMRLDTKVPDFPFVAVKPDHVNVGFRFVQPGEIPLPKFHCSRNKEIPCPASGIQKPNVFAKITDTPTNLFPDQPETVIQYPVGEPLQPKHPGPAIKDPRKLMLIDPPVNLPRHFYFFLPNTSPPLNYTLTTP